MAWGNPSINRCCWQLVWKSRQTKQSHWYLFRHPKSIFDTVNYDILLYKLHNYGIHVVYDWFKNYLSGRYQYISVNRVNSKLTAVESHIEKTSYMTLPHSKDNGTLLCINNQVMSKIWVSLMMMMNWNEVITKTMCIKKRINHCSIFYKCRRILPVRVLKQVYFAFVHSHILYAVEIYANTGTHKSYLDKLIKLNNTFLRIIKKREIHLTEMYVNYSTIPVLLLTTSG